jgi:hypothetical protein
VSGAADITVTFADVNLFGSVSVRRTTVNEFMMCYLF